MIYIKLPSINTNLNLASWIQYTLDILDTNTAVSEITHVMLKTVDFAMSQIKGEEMKT